MTRSPHLFSLLGLLILASASAALGQSTQLIPWDAERLLSWGDFQCPPPANASQLSEAAAIHMTVKWHTQYAVRSERSGGYSWIGTVEDVLISNSMNPRFSWVISSKATAAILRHEQVHFDLNEVYARRLAETLSGVQVSGTTAENTLSQLGEMIQQTADDILDRLSVIQDRYDAETSHGTNASAQAQWESDIRAWLITPSLAP